MSVHQMTDVWQRECSRGEQSILLCMADHANDDGGDIFPSRERIAWKTGYTERQVTRIIRDLIAKGVVEEVEPPGRDRPTEYRIHLDSLPMKAPFTPRRRSGWGDILSPQPNFGVTSEAEMGGHFEHDGVTFSHDGVTSKTEWGDIPHRANHHEPSLEPSVEPSLRKRPASRPPPRRKVELSEDELRRLRADFAALTDLDERIEEALAHKAASRWASDSPYLGVRNWLRRDLERMPRNGRTAPPRNGDPASDPELARLRAIGVVQG